MIAFADAGVVTEDGTVLLRDITLTLADRRIGILGANGSGKTTLVRLINGLTPATSGTVVVDGLDSSHDRRELQRRVGFIFSDADHQLVYPTPLEDVALGLRARGIAADAAKRRALEQLDRMGLAHKADQAIHTLSAGEKHLVALSAVLVLEPEWVVVDEPTTTLDLVNRRRVTQVLLGLPQRLVVVSHDLDLIAAMDYAVLVDDGMIAARGLPKDVTARYLALAELR